jgi:hypothetical protein
MSLREIVDKMFPEQINARAKRTSNNQCKQYVSELKPFKGSNLFAQWVYPENEDEPAQYVVYSWGEHWPLYIYDVPNKQWFQNASHASQGTNAHRWDCSLDVRYLQLDVATMKNIVTQGARTVYRNILAEEEWCDE